MFKKKYSFSFCVFIVLLTFFGSFINLAANAEETSQEEDTLKKIERTKIITWGTDPEGGAPFSFFNPKNPTELIGYEVEIIRKIAEKLGVKDKMVQNDWDALVSALKRKNFDIVISGLEVTEPRKQEVSFSRPYYIYTQQLVVRKENTTIHGPNDLKGKKIGTLSAAAALKILTDMGLSIGDEIKIYPSVVGAYKDLENNRLDAVLLELTIAAYYAKPNPVFKYAGEPFGTGYYAVAVRKEDKDLLKKIDGAIGELLESGEIEKICRKWGLWNNKQNELLSYKENSTNTVKRQSTFDRMPVELPLLLKASLVTLKICFISMIFAILLGLSIAIIRIYAPLPFRFLCAAYVEIFRGTPLLIQLYIIYYGLPQLNQSFRLEAFTAAVIGLSLNYAAYESENYRAGIRSIPKGQMEAALALGMTKTMALRKIIIPQAVKVVIPPVTNDFIAMFKDSSIVSIITMVELTKQYNYLASVSYDYIGLGLMTAAIYFFMSYPASLFAKTIEKRLAKNER